MDDQLRPLCDSFSTGSFSLPIFWVVEPDSWVTTIKAQKITSAPGTRELSPCCPARPSALSETWPTTQAMRLAQGEAHLGLWQVKVATG